MAEETQDPSVRVYNRSSRAFIHGLHVLSGASFATVPKSVADTWIKLFPIDVVEASVAQKELGGLGAVVAEQKTRIAELEAKLAALTAKKPASKAADAV
jgi:hypothetical protein